MWLSLRAICVQRLEIRSVTLFGRPLATVRKDQLDNTRVPRLSESELEEEFIYGSGPGGQNVNKSSNCVYLKHLPTGLAVKCHQARELHRNREIARQMLIDKLDHHFNGDFSLKAQRDRLYKAKRDRQNDQRAKQRDAKLRYKKLLQNNPSSSIEPSESI